MNRQNACVETVSSSEALGSAQATFRGGGGLLFNRANIFYATAIARRAIRFLNVNAACRDISSSCRDQFDVRCTAISRTSCNSVCNRVAKKTLIELDRQNGMLKVIDDDSGVALNRARHHQ